MPAGQEQQFSEFFRSAVEHEPFGFQRRFACELQSLVHISTGLGKTAMAIIGWLWRRFEAGEDLQRQTPRRLMYCLPMRVLVEQTRDHAIRWLHNLKRLGGDVAFDPPLSHHGEFADATHRVVAYTPRVGNPGEVAVYVLMGGENEDEWDIYPERDAIVVGTQDMLLSRALNRGYAASRSRWPMHFGLLHTDCLWVFDEIQLMGSGLATTTQFEAFRRLLPTSDSPRAKDGHGCRSVWMSATMQRDWLNTVDFKDRVDDLDSLELSGDDREHGEVKQRWNAKKPLTRAKATMGDESNLANDVRQAHKPGSRTIVVVNTVRRARKLFVALNQGGGGQATKGKEAAKKQSRPGEASAATAPRIVLLHSRFRPDDRKKQVDAALAPIQRGEPGTIVVSPQVIEAGVDVSATTLFTEVAPWASLVQRFGRCNRRGEENDSASVHWIAFPTRTADAKKFAAPYALSDLNAAAERLTELEDVGLGSLPKTELSCEHTHVIRRKDLMDLFDTTPDLAGNDIDIDRFVREVEEPSDVRVFWRRWKRLNGDKSPPADEPAPRQKELCPAPVDAFRDFTRHAKEHAKDHANQVWRWSFLDKEWEKADAARIAPGQVFLVHAGAGGYSTKTGWCPASTTRVEPVASATGEKPDATDDDRLCRVGVWQTIAKHADEVCCEMDAIIHGRLSLSDAECTVLKVAARWHDWGKAHEMFQIKIDDGQELAVKDSQGDPKRRRKRDRAWLGCRFVGKAPGERKDQEGNVVDPGFWTRHTKKDGGRYHFRHELASALGVLQRPDDPLHTFRDLSDDDLNLAAYLIAAHHGKVRLSIRSLPNEQHPCGRDGKPAPRFARGVWDGDELPETDLGEDGDGRQITAPRVTLSLEPMELGLCEQPPFAGQPSWAERTIRLRDTLGPFRVAYLEALLRAADMRASKAAEPRVAGDRQAPPNAGARVAGEDT